MSLYRVLNEYQENECKMCRKEKFMTLSPTSYDDIVGINQLYTDLFSLHMKVKVWEYDHEPVFQSSTKSEKNNENKETD